MSPIADPSNRGYPDWQRIGDWDSGDLYIIVANGTSLAPLSPVLDVSRWANLGLRIVPLNTYTRVVLSWYFDSLQVNPAGTREFMVDANGGNVIQARIPNLGPFVQAQFIGAPAGNPAISVSLYGTNRTSPTEFIPQEPILISRSNVLINPGASHTWVPSDCFGGPVQVWFDVGTGPLTLFALYLGKDGNYTNFNQADVANGTYQVFTWVLPAAPLRMQVTNNTAGVGNYWLTMTHSMTGSA